MALSSIDAFCNGSSLAHLLQALFRDKPLHAPGIRSGLKVLFVFSALGLLLMAISSIGIAITDDAGYGTLSQHISAWYWAMSLLALLSLVVIQFSLMKTTDVLDVAGDVSTIHHPPGVTSSVLPRPPAGR